VGHAKPNVAPPPERRIIERPRLLNQLEATGARTILLIAPAGYGKTTLARQWMREQSGAWWYTARSGSSDLARLAAGLAESLDVIQPGFHAYVNELLRALPNPSRQGREILEAFTSALNVRTTPTAVMDDYHLLANSIEAETFVHELQEKIGFRLLVASRVRPTWATARRQIYGELIELRKEDLALTNEESSEVLGAGRTRRDLAIVAQARGWPAVIGLAALTQDASAPQNAVSTTLFRFFAEELFRSTPESLREKLTILALLPNLSAEVLREAFDADAAVLLDDAIAYGFATAGDVGRELHPLIREYLLTKLVSQEKGASRVEEVFHLSLRHEAWDHAFDLLRRFTATELLDVLIEKAFKPLMLSGRIATLEQISRFAHDATSHISPLVSLIDAELAFRDGQFAKAESLAKQVTRQLSRTHRLCSHAHWLAGQGAQLIFDHQQAAEHFRQADSTAQDSEDARDAIWGLVVTSLFSESSNAQNAVAELVRRRDTSSTDLLRASTGSMQLMRYTDGFAKPLVVEDALHALKVERDPRVRASFTYNYAYHLVLTGRYDDALEMAESTLEEIDAYQLTWARPHIQWIHAAAHLGLRQFGTAERWLQHVERAADQLHDGHLTLNAAALRSRLLLVMQRREDACSALTVDETLSVSTSMRAEFLATRALALAVIGRQRESLETADRASALTKSVEARALAACARAVLADRSNAGSAELVSWAQVASRLGVWDALICAIRSWPALLPHVAAIPELESALPSALRRSQDYELAKRAGLSLGRKPRARKSTLSPREYEVLQLVRQGLTNSAIAQALFISEATVKVHVRHIFDKVGARTRTEAATRVLDS
jgi:ATP/maltotriose-dependent transcriptional regulator MalT